MIDSGRMSHSVTITRTTTTTSTSAIILNTGYFKTWPGIFKLLQMALGAVVVGLVSYYYSEHHYRFAVSFFLFIAVAFLIGTFLILLSCLISIATASVLPKTVYEGTYHGFAFLLYMIASLLFILEVNRYSKSRYSNDYESYLTAAILGFVVTALYLFSSIHALKIYRGL